MSGIPSPTPGGARRVRDLVAVALIAVGVLTVAFAAYATDWRLGTGVLGAALLTVGILAGLDRDEPEGGPK